MKNGESSDNGQRTYRQKARAKATAATGRAIVESFYSRLQEQWFEEITLDSVAKDAGVTVQTVIRRFGGKNGLLDSTVELMAKSIDVRRKVRPGDIDFSIDALTDDYEEIGPLVLRLLMQEERQPALKPVVEKGRRGHREWLATVFADSLKPLPAAKRKAVLDALVVATDVYVWKLVRQDMGRPVDAFKAIAKSMVEAALKAA